MSLPPLRVQDCRDLAEFLNRGIVGFVNLRASHPSYTLESIELTPCQVGAGTPGCCGVLARLRGATFTTARGCACGVWVVEEVLTE